MKVQDAYKSMLSRTLRGYILASAGYSDFVVKAYEKTPRTADPRHRPATEQYNQMLVQRQCTGKKDNGRPYPLLHDGIFHTTEHFHYHIYCMAFVPSNRQQTIDP